MYGSHSKLQLADACLFAFKKRYIDKVSEPQSRPGRVGSAFHRFAEMYGRHCMENGIQSDISVIPELVKKATYTGDWSGETMGSDIYSEVASLAERFGETHIFSPDTIISLEEKLPAGWDPDNNQWPEPNLNNRHTFVGIIDRLELDEDPETVIVHDYKTSWSVESQSQLEKDPQLRRYAWLVKQEYPQFNNFKIRLDFIRHDIIREAEIGIEAVEDAEEEIIAALNQLQNIDKFDATPGEYCSFCGYSNMCPAFEDKQQIVIHNENRAEKVAREILLLERRLRDRKEALKQFCVTGSVQVDGTEFGHLKSDSVGIKDIKEIRERLKSMEMDPDNYLYVKTRKLKSLLDSDEIHEELEDLLVDKSYTQFRHRKIKGD